VTDVPVVLVNRDSGLGRYPPVEGDNRNGMRAAVGHLIALGHRHITHIAGPHNFSTSRARRQAFETAALAANTESSIIQADSLRLRPDA